MELYDAMLELGSSARPATRAVAGQVVLQNLQAIAKRLRSWSEEERDDAMGIVMLRLLEGGVAPRLPAGARGLLRKMLTSTLISLYRKRGPSGSPVDTAGEDPSADPPSPEDETPEALLLANEEGRIVDELRVVFTTVVVEHAAGNTNGAAASRFREAVARLWAMFEDDKRVADFVTAALGEGPHPQAAIQTLSDTISQQHTRARGRLLRAIQELVEAGKMSPRVGDQMTDIVFLLRERQTST